MTRNFKEYNAYIVHRLPLTKYYWRGRRPHLAAPSLKRAEQCRLRLCRKLGLV